MNGAWIFVLIFLLSIVLGISIGLFRAHYIKKGFPEFFSPRLKNTDKVFADVSANIKAVNIISDEELTYERFTQSRELQ